MKLDSETDRISSKWAISDIRDTLNADKNSKEAFQQRQKTKTHCLLLCQLIQN